MGSEKFSRAIEEKNLGMTMQDDLSPEKHINSITGETYRLITNMTVIFSYLDMEMLR